MRRCASPAFAEAKLQLRAGRRAIPLISPHPPRSPFPFASEFSDDAGVVRTSVLVVHPEGADRALRERDAVHVPGARDRRSGADLRRARGTVAAPEISAAGRPLA